MIRYIDIGAYDGVAASKTHALELVGCEGVCVEASPVSFEKLVANRNCKCINAICSDVIGQKTFRYYPARKMRSYVAGQPVPPWAENEDYTEYQINTVTINSIMEMMKWDYVDFLQVDAEGYDALILNAVDYSRYRFGSIMYEKGVRNYEDPNYLTLEKKLAELGYRKMGTFGNQGEDNLWQESR